MWLGGRQSQFYINDFQEQGILDYQTALSVCFPFLFPHWCCWLKKCSNCLRARNQRCYNRMVFYHLSYPNHWISALVAWTVYLHDLVNQNFCSLKSSLSVTCDSNLVLIFSKKFKILKSSKKSKYLRLEHTVSGALWTWHFNISTCKSVRYFMLKWSLVVNILPACHLTP